MERAKVLLADDHAMLRQALRKVLEREDDIDVVGEANNGGDTLRLAKELAPDVIVMDISMPGVDGINATRRLIGGNSAARVLALSTHAERHFVAQMLTAGARGYVVKTASIAEMLKAVRSLAHGQTYLCQEAANAMAEAVRGNGKAGGPGGDILGRRERDVLTLLAEGRTSQQIGVKLHIATGTVDVHRRNIMRKLGLHTVAELTQYSIREGLITI
jgi:DNA-binding NarL/FixJ family response regulator